MYFSLPLVLVTWEVCPSCHSCLSPGPGIKELEGGGLLEMEELWVGKLFQTYRGTAIAMY
jgi:hypothetical protein